MVKLVSCICISIHCKIHGIKIFMISFPQSWEIHSENFYNWRFSDFMIVYLIWLACYTCFKCIYGIVYKIHEEEFQCFKCFGVWLKYQHDVNLIKWSIKTFYSSIFVEVNILVVSSMCRDDNFLQTQWTIWCPIWMDESMLRSN